MNNKLSISAKCTTYGRVEHLEEALHSFLMQQYDGDAELVIVNDYPLQKLHFDHPSVRIINLDTTFDIIGEKENFAISQCKFNTVSNHDDDDVILPWHFDNINRHFPGHQLLHWNNAIFMMGDKIAALRTVGNCGIVYDKEFVKSKLDSYYPIENEGADTSLVIAIQKFGGKVCRAVPDDKDVSQIYRWGNGSYHLSGQGAYKEGRDNIVKRHSAHIEELRKQGKIPTGDIELKPHWNQDYMKLHNDFVANKK